VLLRQHGEYRSALANQSAGACATNRSGRAAGASSLVGGAFLY
jgi:hypothetical protein